MRPNHAYSLRDTMMNSFRDRIPARSFPGRHSALRDCVNYNNRRNSAISSGNYLKEIPQAWLDRLLPSVDQLSGLDWRTVFGRVFFLDDHGVFRPLDWERVLAGELADWTSVKGLPYNTGEILQQFTALPLDIIHHYAYCGEYLRALFEERKLVDVLIHIGKKKFVAHRIALACHSVYFARAFILNQHKDHKLTQVKLKDISPAAFHTILRFVYSGILYINHDNVDKIAHIAQKLQMPSVFFRCMDFLGTPIIQQKQFNIEPPLDSARIYEQVDLIVHANFREVADSDMFLRLDVEALEIAFADDTLQVESEKDVFRAAMRWICYDLGRRRRHLDRLMKTVRFNCMWPSEIIECTQANNLMRNSPYCRNKALEAIWLLAVDQHETEDVFDLPCPKPRRCIVEKPHWDAPVIDTFLPSPSPQESYAGPVPMVVVEDKEPERISQLGSREFLGDEPALSLETVAGTSSNESQERLGRTSFIENGAAEIQ